MQTLKIAVVGSVDDNKRNLIENMIASVPAAEQDVPGNTRGYAQVMVDGCCEYTLDQPILVGQVHTESTMVLREVSAATTLEGLQRIANTSQALIVVYDVSDAQDQASKAKAKEIIAFIRKREQENNSINPIPIMLVGTKAGTTPVNITSVSAKQYKSVYFSSQLNTGSFDVLSATAKAAHLHKNFVLKVVKKTSKTFFPVLFVIAAIAVLIALPVLGIVPLATYLAIASSIGGAIAHAVVAVGAGLKAAAIATGYALVRNIIPFGLCVLGSAGLIYARRLRNNWIEAHKASHNSHSRQHDWHEMGWFSYRGLVRLLRIASAGTILAGVALMLGPALIYNGLAAIGNGFGFVYGLVADYSLPIIMNVLGALSMYAGFRLHKMARNNAQVYTGDTPVFEFAGHNYLPLLARLGSIILFVASPLLMISGGILAYGGFAALTTTGQHIAYAASVMNSYIATAASSLWSLIATPLANSGSVGAFIASHPEVVVAPVMTAVLAGGIAAVVKLHRSKANGNSPSPMSGVQRAARAQQSGTVSHAPTSTPVSSWRRGQPSHPSMAGHFASTAKTGQSGTPSVTSTHVFTPR